MLGGVAMNLVPRATFVTNFMIGDPPYPLYFLLSYLCKESFKMVISHQPYVLKKLASLSSQDLNMLRTVFAENKHPRFMKEFSFHDPYGKSKFYKEAVANADLENLTKLIGICAMLMQTKVYLFWEKKQ